MTDTITFEILDDLPPDARSSGRRSRFQPALDAAKANPGKRVSLGHMSCDHMPIGDVIRAVTAAYTAATARTLEFAAQLVASGVEDPAGLLRKCAADARLHGSAS